MKHNVAIAGVGMTRFGKHLERSLSSLAHEAIANALADAGIDAKDIQAAWAGTAAAPLITGQTLIAGQAILRRMGIGRIPVINVENACATSATAFHEACTSVSLGVHDVALAFGAEKLFHEDKSKAYAVIAGAIDTERPDELLQFVGEGEPGTDSGKSRSLFMDIYARLTSDYSRNSGATARHYAQVSAKNSVHGSLNPLAQFRDVLSVDDVLAAPRIAGPLTLTMCSPLGDGAAAAVIVSERFARQRGIVATVKVRSTQLASAFDPEEGEAGITAWTARRAYEDAAIAVEDISCAEVHDATSPAELICCEALGFCETGGGPEFVASGASALGGRLPVNTSGGLVRKGHPISATGLGQIHELTQQLRGRAGSRQVHGAKLAVAENGGGFLGRDAAAVVVAVLSR